MRDMATMKVIEKLGNVGKRGNIAVKVAAKLPRKRRFGNAKNSTRPGIVADVAAVAFPDDLFHKKREIENKEYIGKRGQRWKHGNTAPMGVMPL